MADNENTRAPAAAPLPLTDEQIEAIASEWDECHIDAPGGEIEVGPALRRQLLAIRERGTPAAADERSAAVPPKLTDAQIKKAVGASDEFWATSKLFIIGIARAIEDAVCASGRGERETE